MKLIGSPTIHPFFFYTGKLAGYTTWILLPLSVVKGYPTDTQPDYLLATSCIFLVIGLIISGISLYDLGASTRIGLPTDQTSLKISGLYQFSRNPMYVGFHFMTLAAVLYIHTWFVLGLGTYCFVIYHRIILQEEHFLRKTFGDTFVAYEKKVRRYL